MISRSIISVLILWIFVISFFILASKRRKKIRILPSILITLSIIVFALFSQSGRVLLTIGSFRITSDSLLTGLKKSGILIGMVFLSQIFINPKINLPGKPGKFLKDVFMWLDEMTSLKFNFKPGHIIDSLDSRLCQIWNITDQNKDNTND